ncbi:hypothetical protein J1N35_008370 [Gossypium stocksii]|uniref:Uncharacterized protein n=1 Tax=Gossypium stocksii TaxID=47602 RepID=A0A9D3W9A3_9ROSI|nr:hypothetical protein J1N35_008370 [Gossypium stocksii]
MTTVQSVDFDSMEPYGSPFFGDRFVHSFPRHKVVKLDDDTFLQLQKQVILGGLPPEYETVVSSASLSPTTFPLRRVVDALLECENRQAQAVQEVLFATNLVEGSLSLPEEPITYGGRSHVRGCEKGFRSCLQCQIYSWFGHLAQRCYYRYHHKDSAPVPSVEDPIAANHGMRVSDKGDVWFVQSNRRPRTFNESSQNPFDQTCVGQGYYGRPIHDGVRPNFGPNFGVPNCLARSHDGQLGNLVVLWSTKPYARVYSGFDPYIGLS